MSYDGDSFADIDDLDIEKIAEEEVQKQAIQFQTQWQENLLDVGWKNTGEGVNSITVEETPDGYKIGSDKVQVLIAEVGRTPGEPAPPKEPIEDWVHEQSGLPNKGDKDFDNTVFNIRMSISENGIEPKRAARDAWEGPEEEYEKSVQERLED